MRNLALPIHQDAWVWALGSLCQLNRIPFDPDLILEHFPPPHTLGSLIHAAKALGFKTGLRQVSARGIHGLVLPCLTLLVATGPETVEPRPARCGLNELAAGGPLADALLGGPTSRQRSPMGNPVCTLGLIVKADAERVLILEPSSQTPTVLPVIQFERRFTGQVLLFAREAQPAPDEDAPPGPQRPFGWRWFFPELLKYKAIWRDVLLASLAIQLMALATPLFTQVMIDKVVVHHTKNTLIVIGLALLVLMVFTAVMSWVRQYLVLHTGNRVDAVLGTHAFEHLLKLPTRYFERRPTGVVVARLHAVEEIREFLSGTAVTLLLDCPFLLLFLGLMFYYSLPLSLLSLAVLSVIVLLSFLVAPLLRARLNEQFLLGARTQAFLTEYISGIETVKSLQMEPQLKARYGDYLARYLQAGFKTRQLANTYNTAANTLEQLMSLTILCGGAYLVMSSTDFSIGMLVAFQMFAGRLAQPLLRLVGLWQQFQQVRIAVSRLGDIMNAPSEPYSLIPVREGAGAGQIDARHLAFRYADHLPYLYRDFNLSVKPGSSIALMGPSGSGKSTLAKLLQGFYLPTDGQILIDGQDIRYLSANELRHYFGVVPQETVLFSGTIYENLILGNPHAGFDEVIEACKMAGVHAFIERLPQGYETPLGEHGVGLSGGQRQRIAIARALLKRPKILIFDEATSHLDTATAEQFAHTINALKGKVTLLFIAHQLPRGLDLDGVIQLGGQAVKGAQQVA